MVVDAIAYFSLIDQAYPVDSTSTGTTQNTSDACQGAAEVAYNDLGDQGTNRS